MSSSINPQRANHLSVRSRCASAIPGASFPLGAFEGVESTRVDAGVALGSEPSW